MVNDTSQVADVYGLEDSLGEEEADLVAAGAQARMVDFLEDECGFDVWESPDDSPSSWSGQHPSQINQGSNTYSLGVDQGTIETDGFDYTGEVYLSYKPTSDGVKVTGHSRMTNIPTGDSRARSFHEEIYQEAIDAVSDAAEACGFEGSFS